MRHRTSRARRKIGHVARLARLASFAKLAIFAVVLPVLVLVPTAGGNAALFHAHGEEGAHAHFAPADIDSPTAAHLEAWHCAEHGAAQGDPARGLPAESSDDPDAAHAWLRLADSVAPKLVNPCPAAVGHAPIAPFDLFSSTIPRRLADADSRMERAQRRAPPRAVPGGIVSLLRSSHALLI
jgi:hypothetical protein